MTNNAEMIELNDTFAQFDKNNDGKLSQEELLEGYKKIVGLHSATEETDMIMRNVDTDGSGYIDYSEFITASMNRRTLLSKQNLNAAFESFDQDHNGTISVDEVKAVLGRFTEASDDIWRQIVAKVDKDGNGILDLKEFKDMMIELF
jgi:calcium-dependent protein kinase